MKAQKINRQAGFTLIETLMAMAIFTIGILGLFGMQTAVIKKNLTANNITNGATWAADQVERIISLDYNYFKGDKGCDALGRTGDDPNDVDNAADSILLPENSPLVSGTTEPIYKIYWNVAKDCVITGIPPGDPGDETESAEQRPKYLRIIVTRQSSNESKTEVAVFNYIKQNSRNKN